MTKNAQRRSGSTTTFSVSVDAATKQALRALAESDFGGNLSALIIDFAAEARRRMAAADYLALQGLPKVTPAEAKALQASLHAELGPTKKRRKKRQAA